MRINLGDLRDFVEGAFTVPQMPVVLRGTGDFVAGSYTVPQTPVRRPRGTGDFVGGSFPLPTQPSGIGNLVPTGPMYPVPQNSVITAWNGAGMSGLGCSSDYAPPPSSCGCSGSKSSGMGDVCLGSVCLSGLETAFTDLSTAITSASLTPLTSTDYMYLAGTALIAYLVLNAGKKGRR